MNRAIDYRTDFYSLGVTFYELLTGHLPFPTTDLLKLVHCHLAKPPVPPHELNETIPEPISDLILKLMAKNAEDRYQSAWGIKADLKRCREQLAARGQAAPIQLGLQDVSDQFQLPQKLYGREAEIAALLAVLERVVGEDPESTTPSSEMMLVSGYSGIGKSALIRELYKPISYVQIGTSHDTAEVACDAIRHWWQEFGQHHYPTAPSILLLCDGGGSNSSRQYLFKQDLQALVNDLGIEIRIAHYPPYTFKYNPIEHRLFPHLTRACQGAIFDSVETVKELMARAKTQTGLSVVVNIVDKVYQTGRKVAADFKQTMEIVFDEHLSQWNYTAKPQAA